MTTAFDSLPAVSGSVSAASGSASAASGSVSAASGSASAASGSVPAASGSVSAASLHPFPLSAGCVSTTDGVSEQSFPMRGDLFQTPAVSFGFYSTSRHSIPRLSPRNTNRKAITANNGAAANRYGCHGSCYSRSWPSRAVGAFSHVRCRLLRPTLAATAPASAVAELTSLAAPTRRPAKKHSARHANSKPTTE